MSIDPNIYKRVREHVGIFDASGAYGRLFAKGKDALDLLHRMSSNDMKPLETATGQSALTALLNEKGRFVDVLKVVRDSTGEVLLITSSGAEETVIRWLDKFTIMEDARFEMATEVISQFLVCGPDATSIIGRYATADITGEWRTTIFDLQIGDAPATLVKAPSLAGSGWFILTEAQNSEAVLQGLQSGALSRDGAIIDPELFALLRIENGTPIAPNEINDKHGPLELPLASEAVSFTKGCYIGQEVIARLDAQGKVQRKLVGLKFEDGIPNVGDRISDPSLVGTNPLGDEIGDITSVAISPVMGAIGLGYVRAKHASPGRMLTIIAQDGNTLHATIVTLPFDV